MRTVAIMIMKQAILHCALEVCLGNALQDAGRVAVAGLWSETELDDYTDSAYYYSPCCIAHWKFFLGNALQHLACTKW